MRHLLLSSLAIVATLLSSCSPYVITSSNLQSGANLARYRTFSINPIVTQSLPRNVKITSAEALTNEVTRELENRGYTRVAFGGEIAVTLTLSAKSSVERDSDISGIRSTQFYGGVGYVGVGYGTRGNIKNGGVKIKGTRSGISPTFNSSISANIATSTQRVTDGIITMDIQDLVSNDYLFYSEISAGRDMQNLVVRDHKESSKAVDKLFKKFPIKESRRGR